MVCGGEVAASSKRRHAVELDECFGTANDPNALVSGHSVLVCFSVAALLSDQP